MCLFYCQAGIRKKISVFYFNKKEMENVICSPPHDRQLEKLMSQLPYFKPSGHGSYLYEEREYSAEKCSCREYTHRKKKKRSKKPAPPCIEQGIRVGEIPLGEILQEPMFAVTNPTQ